MRVGVGLPNTVPGASPELQVEWAAGADDGPFSSVAVLDRVNYPSHEPLATLAAAVQVTKRVELATTVVIGPLRDTRELARSAQSIHEQSSGRLTVGLGIGARTDDYDASGVSPAGRGRRLSEQLFELRRLWRAPEANAHGTPGLIVGGGSDAAFARAARFADGYVHGGGPPRAFARARDRVLTAWEDFSRPGKPRFWAQGYFALGDDAAVSAGRDYMLDYYAFTGPFAQRIAEGLLTSPQGVAQFVRGYAEAGCDDLVLFPAVAERDQLERLAEVLAEGIAAT